MLVQAELPCKWTNDCERFLLEHFDTISTSPSHIYYSALPFCPSSSWLRECYDFEISEAVKVVKGIQTKWGTCSRTVPLGNFPNSLSHGDNTLAIGLDSGDIIILDALTGTQTGTLSGHAEWVWSIVFSLDGTLLVSGSSDKTVMLWDMQTGGTIKPFHGHTKPVHSVSISTDCTRIASGSDDQTIRLWNIQTGECYHSIKMQAPVEHISFFPKFLISISSLKVQKWNLNGHKTKFTCDGSYVAVSPDYTQFCICNKETVTVYSTNSGAIVAKLQMLDDDDAEHCCFSPDGKHIAVVSNEMIDVWNITSPEPDIIESFESPAKDLIFTSPSSLISTSEEGLVKFWQIGHLSENSVISDTESTSESTSSALYSAQFARLQIKDSIAISGHSSGVVKIWDLITGDCKESFQTPAAESLMADAQLANGKLIFVWHNYEELGVWDSEEGESSEEFHEPELCGLQLSGDNSKIFTLASDAIKALSVQTFEVLSRVELEPQVRFLDPLYMDGSRIWVRSRDLSVQGWDFGVSGSSPIPLPNASSGRPQLEFINGAVWNDDVSFIKDTITNKTVFQLSGGYAKPHSVQWDGQYLAAIYENGEVLILDFDYLCSK